jgi:hypothetical protein
MSIISKVVRKTHGARRFPEKGCMYGSSTPDPARTAGHASLKFLAILSRKPRALPEADRCMDRILTALPDNNFLNVFKVPERVLLNIWFSHGKSAGFTSIGFI